MSIFVWLFILNESYFYFKTEQDSKFGSLLLVNVEPIRIKSWPRRLNKLFIVMKVNIWTIFNGISTTKKISSLNTGVHM